MKQDLNQEDVTEYERKSWPYYEAMQSAASDFTSVQSENIGEFLCVIIS